jgi:hypothetical protein
MDKEDLEGRLLLLGFEERVYHMYSYYRWNPAGWVGQPAVKVHIFGDCYRLYFERGSFHRKCRHDEAPLLLKLVLREMDYLATLENSHG